MTTHAPASPLFDASPGAEPRSTEVSEALRAALLAQGDAYVPRTKHRRVDGAPRFANRLLLETSPYLRQHAHNPVDWRPWGDEAFAEAARLGRPVLLSVGYSTCHWCHVMEEESFEDEEVARVLNELYVPVKVDREERPDVDQIYMAAVQALTGGGGWPMTVWLTPDRRPYYGGTYFPARDGERGARTGFVTLLRELRGVYDGQPERIELAATEIVDAVKARLSGAVGTASPALPTDEMLHEAYRFYEKHYDATWGGIAHPPKFPSSLPARFLLRYHARFGVEHALAMATTTLRKMAAGGLHDHVAGGFHRYSTDERWLVPHFEKMLYDNALLALSYLEAWQATDEQDLAVVANDILLYVDRDMTSPEGGFYSATDADSANPEKGGERDEGWYFTWTPDELSEVLGQAQANTIAAYYAVEPGGNFEGRSILHTPRPRAEVARQLRIPEIELAGLIDAARSALCDVRGKRPAPLRDEKILAAWNGLMISAFARGGHVLGEPHYVEIATKAADFVMTRMTVGGKLRRSFKDGEARFNAYLEDYAFVIAGLVDLFESGAGTRYLEAAVRLDKIVEAQFEDHVKGGWFMTSSDHETLLVREKPNYDGATPSGSSVMAQNLLRLAELTGKDSYRLRAESAFKAFHGLLAQAPAAMSEMLMAVDFYLDRPKQVIVVAKSDLSETEPFLNRLRHSFLPNKVLTVLREGDDAESLAALVPMVKDKVASGGRATAYVCVDKRCNLPTADLDVFSEQLQS